MRYFTLTDSVASLECYVVNTRLLHFVGEFIVLIALEFHLLHKHILATVEDPLELARTELRLVGHGALFVLEDYRVVDAKCCFRSYVHHVHHLLASLHFTSCRSNGESNLMLTRSFVSGTSRDSIRSRYATTRHSPSVLVTSDRINGVETYALTCRNFGERSHEVCTASSSRGYGDFLFSCSSLVTILHSQRHLILTFFGEDKGEFRTSVFLYFCIRSVPFQFLGVVFVVRLEQERLTSFHSPITSDESTRE